VYGFSLLPTIEGCCKAVLWVEGEIDYESNQTEHEQAEQAACDSEDWEFRRYHANQIHFATAGLMEVFFAAKIELYFLTAALETLLAGLNQLTAQADAIVRQQGVLN
jgi:hypothetical protein